MKKFSTPMVALIALVIAGLAIVGGVALEKSQNKSGMDHSQMSMNGTDSDYSLNLMSGNIYAATEPTRLHFAIQDKDGKALKEFDTVHEKQLHLIVVRKDRTNFQHVHPMLDEQTGMFTMESFAFPTDGDFRVFAEFTPSNSQEDSSVGKPAVVAYRDVQAGDVSKYEPQPLGQDKLASSVNGFNTALSVASDSQTSDFTANATTTVAVVFNKDGSPYKNLQRYLGALGHMVVLGPDLEYIHAHALSEDVTSQTGTINFAVDFKDAGQYKVYLQTQANGQENTTDYTVTTKSNTENNSKSESKDIDHGSGH